MRFLRAILALFTLAALSSVLALPALADKVIIRTDDFSKDEPDSARSFYEGTIGDAVYKYMDEGLYQIDATKSDYYGLSVYVDTRHNYSVEADAFLKQTDLEKDASVGLAFNYTKTDTVSGFYAFVVRADGDFAVMKDVIDAKTGADAWSDVIASKTDPIIKKNDFNKLRVDVNGSDFIFYVNGQEVAKASDASGTLGGGGVGFYVAAKSLGLYKNFALAAELVPAASFTNDFSPSGAKRFMEGESFGTKYVYKDGYYEIDSSTGQSIGIAEQMQTVQDFTLSATAKYVSGGDDVGYGLFFRLSTKPSGEYDYYRFLISADGQWCFQKTVGGEDSFVLEWSPSDKIKHRDVNQLKVEAHGQKFTFYVNDEAVGETRDNSIESGTFGLITGSGLVIDFDDMALTVS
jgi:hypothetical protein